MSELIQLHSDDNVLVCIVALKKGANLDWQGVNFSVEADIGVGHKLASKAIASGEKIIKYGAPIGSALCDIALGEHVHSHNIKSDYIPSHGREHFAEGGEA
jgi:(2R)-sulfolactate sulfo-lyase subunit alpha